MSEQAIYNQRGEKVGHAVWTGERDARGVMVGWDVVDLSDHIVATVTVIRQAVEILNPRSI